MKKLGTLELWRNGIPISEAWLDFASAELQRKYKRHPKMPKKLGEKTGIGMLVKAGGITEESAFELMQNIGQSVHHSRTRREMEAALVDN